MTSLPELNDSNDDDDDIGDDVGDDVEDDVGDDVDDDVDDEVDDDVDDDEYGYSSHTQDTVVTNVIGWYSLFITFIGINKCGTV